MKRILRCLTIAFLLVILSLSCQTEDSDGKPPVPGGDGLLSYFDPTSQTVGIAWYEARDNETPAKLLQYRIVYSEFDNIQNNNDINYNITGSTDWMVNTTSGIIDQLTADKEYYINVQVRDQSGNTAAYKSRMVRTRPISTIRFNSPTHSYYESNPTLDYTIEDSTATAEFTLNGTSWYGNVGDSLYPEAGLNQLDVIVTNNFGESVTDSVVFFYNDFPGYYTIVQNDNFERGTTIMPPESVWTENDNNGPLLRIENTYLAGLEKNITGYAYDYWRQIYGGSMNEIITGAEIQDIREGVSISLRLWAEGTVYPEGYGNVGLGFNLSNDGYSNYANLYLFEHNEETGEFIPFSSDSLTNPGTFSYPLKFYFYKSYDEYQGILTDSTGHILIYTREYYTREIPTALSKQGFYYSTDIYNSVPSEIFSMDNYIFYAR